MYEFITTKDFVDDFNKLEKSLQPRIKEKLSFLIKTENPLLFAKKLKGYKDVFRFRIGDYRLVFKLEKQKIILIYARHRKDIYEGL
jgi:mRNA interferase RelE/StbE